MKKKYEKPVIAFENMELNTTIAACEITEITPRGTGIVSELFPGAILFDLQASDMNCDTSGKDIYCYHNPYDLAMKVNTHNS